MEINLDPQSTAVLTSFLISVTVGITKAIMDTISGRKQKLIGCFLAAQKEHPDKTGQERLAFAIDIARSLFPDDKNVEADIKKLYSEWEIAFGEVKK